jgi:uncharacterized protein (AIM24 family)
MGDVLWRHYDKRGKYLNFSTTLILLYLTLNSQLQPNEQHIVDNGHLVAWNCRYSVERAGKGALSSMTTGEGVVCRFTGPGKIYIQTRNLDEFADWVRSVVPRQG